MAVNGWLIDGWLVMVSWWLMLGVHGWLIDGYRSIGGHCLQLLVQMVVE